MKILSTPTGAIQANCYIVFNDDRNALVIDPGADAERITQIITDHNLNIIGYPLTHGHYDHIGALPALHAKWPAPIGLHAKDAAWAFTPINAMPPYYPAISETPPISRSYQDKQTFSDESFQYSIIFTPGHSPGGVCFYFENEHILFGGDNIFKGSVGRVDLPGSHPPDMKTTLEKLMKLPDETIVYSGHGPETTIGAERRTNPYILNPDLLA